MVRATWAGLATVLLVACAAMRAPDPSPAPSPLADATQLMVVTTTGWDSITGELRRFVRDDVHAPWRSAGNVTPIVVGRTGLAWGVGFDEAATVAEPHKREGDGRSPAGIFPVRTAFGFPPADSMRWVRLPYLSLSASTECVDDTASQYYNEVVDRNTVSRVDWQSSERMRSVKQYQLGAIIQYNATPVKGRGSCIFFHIWGGPRAPTVGCTALEPTALQGLIAWLDPRARPVVVQVPATVYARVQNAWHLPQLP